MVGLAGLAVVRDVSHPDVAYDAHKCILCQRCVQVAEGAGDGPPGLSLAGRGASARVCAPFDLPLSAAIGSATALRCAQVCPTSALRAKSSAERRSADG